MLVSMINFWNFLCRTGGNMQGKSPKEDGHGAIMIRDGWTRLSTLLCFGLGSDSPIQIYPEKASRPGQGCPIQSSHLAAAAATATDLHSHASTWGGAEGIWKMSFIRSKKSRMNNNPLCSQTLAWFYDCVWTSAISFTWSNERTCNATVHSLRVLCKHCSLSMEKHPIWGTTCQWCYSFSNVHKHSLNMQEIGNWHSSLRI